MACAPSAPPPARLDAGVQPRDVATATERATRIDRPYTVVFGWRLNDSGRRVGGRGVARLAPPYRARLDLFTENGETAAVAALVAEEVRLGAGVEEELVPPPPLLWASLGVLHPGREASLLGAGAADGAGILLRYGLEDGGELRFRVAERAVRGAEVIRGGHVVERVRVEDESGLDRFPREANYRDLTAFRELTVTLESAERVPSHPEEIWHPGR